MINGVIQVTIYKTTFAIRTGSHFYVPPSIDFIFSDAADNQYRIVNIGERTARLLLFQTN